MSPWPARRDDFAFYLPLVMSAAVTVWPPAVLRVTPKDRVPALKAALAGKMAMLSLELALA